jgi:hypothetical protein
MQNTKYIYVAGGKLGDVYIIAGHMLNIEYGLPYFVDGKLDPNVDIFAAKSSIVVGNRFNLYIPGINMSVFIENLTEAANALAEVIDYHVSSDVLTAITNNDLVKCRRSSTYVRRDCGRVIGSGHSFNRFCWRVDYISSYKPSRYNGETHAILYDAYGAFGKGLTWYSGIEIDDKNKLIIDYKYVNPLMPSLYTSEYSNDRYLSNVIMAGNIKHGKCTMCCKVLCEMCVMYNYTHYCMPCYLSKNRGSNHSVYTVDTTFAQAVAAIPNLYRRRMLQSIHAGTIQRADYTTEHDTRYTMLLMGEKKEYLGVLDNYYKDLDLADIFKQDFAGIKYIVRCKYYDL